MTVQHVTELGLEDTFREVVGSRDAVSLVTSLRGPGTLL